MISTHKENHKKESTSHFVTDVENLSHKLGKDLGAAATGALQKTEEYAENTRGYIKSHPLQSIAIATAAGFALGSIFTLIARRK